MVNTRNSQCNGQPSCNNNNSNNSKNNVNLEQLITT
jgi:membrane-bound lytic murein transglycosylase B